MPAMKLTTTIGNVLDPKWHPTLPIVAYTATYSGRRDVYLLDLRSTTGAKTPMRLTYWDIGAGGVSGLIGWISNGNDSYSLLFRAMSNEVSLPDYRLYMIHLDNSSSSGVLEIEPLPLAQAMDAARYGPCWYFVRYKQSSHTIRYVGGTAENLWKYCDDEPTSQRLFNDDTYKGTSKDPQIYNDGEYLFFLSDRGLHGGNEWIPDRMNVWAVPLKNNNDKKITYSTKDMIQITDTNCDFEGRTIQEYSVDSTTGNMVVRIGADLYIMSKEAIQTKLNNKSRFRALADGNQTTVDIDSTNDTNTKDDDSSDKTENEDETTTEETDKKEDEQQQDPATEVKEDAKNDDASQTEEAAQSGSTSALPDETKDSVPETEQPVTTTTPSPSAAVIVVDDTEEVESVTAVGNTTDNGNSTKKELPKYFYDYQPPELVSRKVNNGVDQEDHFAGHSKDLKRLPIVVYSDFNNMQERILPVSIVKHYTYGDVFDTISQSTKMLFTLRGQLWVNPVVQDALPAYEEAGKNLPARQYRIAPGAMMGGATRILAARHVPNPVEDGTSDRRLAVILATDPLTSTAEHAFYLIEVQPGATPLFVDMDQLPKPFLGGLVSGGSTRDAGGLGSVRPDTLAVSPCGNRMAWSDTDGRIVVMNLPQYQELTDRSQPVKYEVLPKENELGEPMVGDEVELTFSPGGRYLAVQHNARNQFQVISIVDLGDPLGEENKIADITLGRIVQATPARFNSKNVYWGKSPTDIHDFARDQKMAQLFGLEDPDDVATTLYFLSDRDIKTDVTSPWGDRQKMPHFVENTAVYAIPLKARDVESNSVSGQFRGGGAEEAHVKTLLERMSLLQSLLKSLSSSSRRLTEESINPLSGVFGVADRTFRDKKLNDNRKLEESAEQEDDHLKEAVFPKDMDIDFGPVDLSFARSAYRIANIPEGVYMDIVCQIPDDGSLVMIEKTQSSGAVVNIFLADEFPSDNYDSQTFVATSRKLGAWGLSTSREYFYLLYAPDGATRVVPNSLKGVASLLKDLVLDDSVADHDDLHLSIWPSMEYRQMYDDAWRMLRDYFYDPDMTGIDWPVIHERYLPLVDRCTKREELDDVLIQMASELSALHVFVYGGEYPSPTHEDKKLEYVNDVGGLGAALKRTPEWKGYKVMSIPRPDPDFTMIDQSTTIYSPLSHQALRLSGQRGLEVGDVIVGVNGESVMSVPDIHMLLRGTAGKSIRLDVLRLASGPDTSSNETVTEEKETAKDGDEVPVDPLITVPLDSDASSDLLYHAWEWKTEKLAHELAAKAGISIGYVHLQDMSGPEAEDAFARGFFPNYQKQGFILDLRHNRGKFEFRMRSLSDFSDIFLILTLTFFFFSSFRKAVTLMPGFWMSCSENPGCIGNLETLMQRMADWVGMSTTPLEVMLLF